MATTTECHVTGIPAGTAKISQIAGARTGGRADRRTRGHRAEPVDDADVFGRVDEAGYSAVRV